MSSFGTFKMNRELAHTLEETAQLARQEMADMTDEQQAEQNYEMDDMQEYEQMSDYGPLSQAENQQMTGSGPFAQSAPPMQTKTHHPDDENKQAWEKFLQAMIDDFIRGKKAQDLYFSLDYMLQEMRNLYSEPIWVLMEIDRLCELYRSAPDMPMAVRSFCQDRVKVLDGRGRFVEIVREKADDPTKEEFLVIYIPTFDQSGWNERAKPAPKPAPKPPPDTVSRPIGVTYESRNRMVTRLAIPRGGKSAQGNTSGGFPISRQAPKCYFCKRVSSYEWRTGPLPLRNQCEFCRKVRDAGHCKRRAERLAAEAEAEVKNLGQN